jgi:multiple sugar transport system permease protein
VTGPDVGHDPALARPTAAARGPRPGERRRGVRWHRGLSARRARTGMVLVAPSFAMVAVFVLFPLGFAVYISLTNWPLIGPYHFIGGQNYTEIIHDPEFIHSVLFTLLYTAIVTGPIFVIGYAMAVLVRSNRRGATFFRTAFFLPFIIGTRTPRGPWTTAWR